MYVDSWFVTEVWYCDQEGWNTWMITCKDDQGDCLGESEYCYHKADAVDMAKAYLDSGRCKFIVVEKKNGQHQYTKGAA